MADKLNLCVLPGKFNTGLQCQVSGFVDRITVNSAAYSWKRDALQAFPAGEFQTVLIGRYKQPGLVLRTVAVDGAHGMDDVPCVEVAASRDDGFAGRAASDLTALGHNRRPTGTVDSAVHTGATGKTAVGGIDNGIRVFRGDVSRHKFNDRLIESGLHLPHSPGTAFPSP